MIGFTQDAVPARHARTGRRSLHVPSLIVLGALVLAAITITGCSRSDNHSSTKVPSSAADTYGSLPSFLPTTSGDADSVLIGSAASPALTTEGDGVEVHLAGGTVLATVTGPAVPGEGLPEQTESTTCTWTVTLSGASTTVHIRLADFTTLDHLGAVYPTHLAPGSRTPPAQLTPGSSTTFSLRTVMPTGEGLMRWTAGGRRIIASWDFEVEND